MTTLTLAEELLYTVDDWENFPDDGNRYEIIEGELFVSTAPRFIHQLLSARIVTLLSIYVNQQNLGVVLHTPGVIFSKKNAVIPDVIFISRERLKHFLIDERIQGAPELAIEILSPGKSNRDRDRVTKLKLYSRFPVLEYWIVDPQRKIIEAFRQTPDGLRPVETVSETEILVSPLFPEFSLAVAELFQN